MTEFTSVPERGGYPKHPDDDPYWEGRVLWDRIPVPGTDFTLIYSGSVPRESEPLIEHSDFPGRQPGWYAIRPILFGRMTSLVVKRMYGSEGQDREILHQSVTWSHPSREYTCEIARQVAAGERHTYHWKRRGWKGEGTGEPGWVNAHPSHVTVTRISDDSEPDRNVFLLFGPGDYATVRWNARKVYRPGLLRTGELA